MWQEVLCWTVPYALTGLAGILVLWRSVSREWERVRRIDGYEAKEVRHDVHGNEADRQWRGEAGGLLLQGCRTPSERVCGCLGKQNTLPV